MDEFQFFRFVHIVSSTVLFGTGLGTAFHMWMTHRSGNVAAIAAAAVNTVRADWWFTTPAVVVQPASGIVLIYLGGHDPHAPWLMAAYALYLLAALCWIPVVIFQIRVRDIAQSSHSVNAPLPDAYFALMRKWFWLGWPAFISVMLTFYLMVSKPLLW